MDDVSQMLFVLLHALQFSDSLILRFLHGYREIVILTDSLCILFISLWIFNSDNLLTDWCSSDDRSYLDLDLV